MHLSKCLIQPTLVPPHLMDSLWTSLHYGHFEEKRYDTLCGPTPSLFSQQRRLLRTCTNNGICSESVSSNKGSHFTLVGQLTIFGTFRLLFLRFAQNPTQGSKDLCRPKNNFVRGTAQPHQVRREFSLRARGRGNFVLLLLWPSRVPLTRPPFSTANLASFRITCCPATSALPFA